MLTVRVSEFLTDPILVSRESARLLEEPIRSTMEESATTRNVEDGATVTIDFEGVMGVAPSFIDELLQIFESHIGKKSEGRERSLTIANPPARLSSKFEAIARGHKMSVRALPDGSWFWTATNDHSP